MPRSVKVKVKSNGSVEADFTGFAGSDCLEEAERLAANLVRFGLRVDVTGQRKKPASEIAAEVGSPEAPRDPVPTRRQ